MKLDDLDRALSESREIQPSGGFAASVMVAVRRDAQMPPALTFPWKRAVVGLTTCAALTIVGVALALTSGPVRWVTPDWFDRNLVAVLSAELYWTAGSLLASLVSFRWSMRLVGYRS